MSSTFSFSEKLEMAKTKIKRDIGILIDICQVKVGKSLRNSLNKWFQDSIKNYFLEVYAAPLIVKELGLKGSEDVKRYIRSTIQKGEAKFILMINQYYFEIVRFKKLDIFKKKLFDLVFSSIEDNPDHYNLSYLSYNKQKNIRKQLVGLILIQYCQCKEEGQEVTSFYDLWNIIYPDDKQHKKKLSRYDSMRLNKSKSVDKQLFQVSLQQKGPKLEEGLNNSPKSLIFDGNPISLNGDSKLLNNLDIEQNYDINDSNFPNKKKLQEEINQQHQQSGNLLSQTHKKFIPTLSCKSKIENEEIDVKQKIKYEENLQNIRFYVKQEGKIRSHYSPLKNQTIIQNFSEQDNQVSKSTIENSSQQGISFSESFSMNYSENKALKQEYLSLSSQDEMSPNQRNEYNSTIIKQEVPSNIFDDKQSQIQNSEREELIIQKQEYFTLKTQQNPEQRKIQNFSRDNNIHKIKLQIPKDTENENYHEKSQIMSNISSEIQNQNFFLSRYSQQNLVVGSNYNNTHQKVISQLKINQICNHQNSQLQPIQNIYIPNLTFPNQEQHITHKQMQFQYNQSTPQQSDNQQIIPHILEQNQKSVQQGYLQIVKQTPPLMHNQQVNLSQQQQEQYQSEQIHLQFVHPSNQQINSSLWNNQYFTPDQQKESSIYLLSGLSNYQGQQSQQNLNYDSFYIMPSSYVNQQSLSDKRYSEIFNLPQQYTQNISQHILENPLSPFM